MGGRISRKRTPPLPSVPCDLYQVPIGAAVRIDVASTRSSIMDCRVCEPDCGGSLGWYLVTFKIGTLAVGSRNLRALFVPPTDARWIHSPDHNHLVPPSTRVLEIAWPRRATDADQAEVADPVGGSAGNGPLFADVAEPGELGGES